VAGVGSIFIPNYSGATFRKQIVGSAFVIQSAVAAFNFTFGGEWANTAAVNEVTVATAAGNFIAGSTFTIYLLP
jgi:hypothetical protein